MKVLLIHNKYKQAGGEDSVVESEKELLERNGHQVRLYYFNNGAIDSFKKKIKLSYQLVYNPESGEIIKDLISDFRPDIMHVHNLFYLASPSILFTAHVLKIPIVVTLHNYRLICSGALLMRDSKPCELCLSKTFPVEGVKFGCYDNSKLRTAQLTFMTGIHKFIGTWNSKVTTYIALTDFARERFLNSSLKLPSDKIVVKANSVADIIPLSSFEREDYFLFVGRLSEEKGINVLLAAFEGANIIVEIIGDGPLRISVETAAQMNRNIKYSGYKDKKYIFSRLRKCRALIVPSVCYEGLPTAILESFSSGTPVIISDIGNLNSIVDHGFTGLHFKTNDPKSLLNVVVDFHQNETLYQGMYSNARAAFVNRYSDTVNYQNMMNIYQSAIDKG